jgi:hypothetical protein
LYEVELDILPRRDVADASRVGVSQPRKAPQLIRRQPSKGDLDPDHLNAGLTLAIDAMLEAKRFEDIAGDLSGIQALHFALEGFDFLQDLEGNRVSLDLDRVCRPERGHVTPHSLETGTRLEAMGKSVKAALSIE